MYVYFRLLKTIIVALCQKKLSPFDTTSTYMRVWPNDIDYNMHLNNGRFLTLMDIGRMDLTVRSGLIKVMMKNRWVPIVGSAHITYLREIPFLRRFRIDSKVLTWDEKWFYLQQDFKIRNQLHARAVVKAVFKEKGRTVKPQEIIDEMGLKHIDPEYTGLFKEQFDHLQIQLQDLPSNESP